jgi:membrane associated rhomboid family serine protease
VSTSALGALRRIPVITSLACVACLAVFAGLHAEPSLEPGDALANWGYYHAFAIRDGKLWGLVTSTFVHRELWHLAFNVYWLWVLGGRLERAIGPARYTAFFVAAAAISSVAEVAASGSTGIGASGVVYAVFGSMWTTRNRCPELGGVPNRRTVELFLTSLWLCLGLSLAGIFEVGNAAHFAGIAFGAGCGAWTVRPERRTWIASALASSVVLLAISLYWAPWSWEWAGWRAVSAHRDGDYPTAVEWYRKSLALGGDPAWCFGNLALAYDAMGDADRYDESLRKLRELDAEAAREIEADVAGQRASVE